MKPHPSTFQEWLNERSSSKPKECNWVYDEDSYMGEPSYETSCGNAFVIIEGTPSDNKFKFCPYCGFGIKHVC